MLYGIRVLINCIIVFFMTFWCVTALVLDFFLELPFPLIIASYIVKFLFLSILIFHYLSWWNAFLDATPGGPLDMNKSLNSQLWGTILAGAVSFLLFRPSISMHKMFDYVFLGLFGSMICCDIGILFTLFWYKKITRGFLKRKVNRAELATFPNRALESSSNNTDSSLQSISTASLSLLKSFPKASFSSIIRLFLSLLGATISMSYFSFSSLWLVLRSIDPETRDVADTIVVSIVILAVSYLCPRFILRARQLVDICFERSLEWSSTLYSTFISSVLNLILMSFFPINHQLQVLSIDDRIMFVGFSSFLVALGSSCVLVYYIFSHKEISWTGLQVSPSHS